MFISIHACDYAPLSIAHYCHTLSSIVPPPLLFSSHCQRFLGVHGTFPKNISSYFYFVILSFSRRDRISLEKRRPWPSSIDFDHSKWLQLLLSTFHFQAEAQRERALARKASRKPLQRHYGHSEISTVFLITEIWIARSLRYRSNVRISSDGSEIPRATGSGKEVAKDGAGTATAISRYIIRHHHGHSVFPPRNCCLNFCMHPLDKWKQTERQKSTKYQYNCRVGLEWTGKKKLLLIEEVVPDTLFFANSCLLVCENYSVIE